MPFRPFSRPIHMETNFTQQEILLMTGTSFAAGQLDQKNETDQLSERQRLEEACWRNELFSGPSELSWSQDASCSRACLSESSHQSAGAINLTDSTTFTVDGESC